MSSCLGMPRRLPRSYTPTKPILTRSSRRSSNDAARSGCRSPASCSIRPSKAQTGAAMSFSRISPQVIALRLFENRGAGARGCRLDQAALAEATARVEGSLEQVPQLLVLNKFGKAECEGGGLRDLIASAIDRGIPVVIGVPERNLEAWRSFAGEFAMELPDHRNDVARWLEGLAVEHSHSFVRQTSAGDAISIRGGRIHRHRDDADDSDHRHLRAQDLQQAARGNLAVKGDREGERPPCSGLAFSCRTAVPSDIIGTALLAYGLLGFP